MTARPPLIVLLEGHPIGRIDRAENGLLTLRYDNAYSGDPDATPLSVSMPRTSPVHTNGSIAPWMWGLLPDNERVLDRWARQFQVSATSPFSLLSSPVGHDCAGAVQFAHPDDVVDLMDRPGSRRALTRGQVADRLGELRRDSTSWLGPAFTGQFSLAGAQAKLALHHNGKSWGEPDGALPTTHILKPAVMGFEAQEINEHLCLSAARNLGLVAAISRIERFGVETAIVVDRYDRTTVDGTLLRIHQEDMCQAAGRPPTAKYQSEGGPSPAEIVDVLRSSIPGIDGLRAAEGFADGLIFNWLVAGTDAHAKNYSVRLSGTQARLAPLYDIASMLPYDDSKGHKLKLAMKIGGEYQLLRTDRRPAWVRFATELGLSADTLIDRAQTMAEQVTDAFTDAAAESAVRELGSDLPARLIDLVAQRSARCQRALLADETTRRPERSP